MKEYKIITLTPTTSSCVSTMEGYIKSCETDLNKLAKEGWKLVCTESIPQQELSNLILFMEREATEDHLHAKKEKHEILESISRSEEIYLEHDPISLPKN